MFSLNYNGPGLWSDYNNLFCFCDNLAEPRSNSVGTMFPEYTNCTDTRSVSSKYCTWVNTRKERSKGFFEREFERRMLLTFERKDTTIEASLFYELVFL